VRDLTLPSIRRAPGLHAIDLTDLGTGLQPTGTWDEFADPYKG